MRDFNTLYNIVGLKFGNTSFIGCVAPATCFMLRLIRGVAVVIE